MQTAVSTKPLSDASDRVWPLGSSVTVLIGLMVAIYLAFLVGWFVGYDAAQVLR
jgi:hypothetical protein